MEPRVVLHRILTPGSFPAALARLGRSARLNAYVRESLAVSITLGYLYLCPRCDACAAVKARRHTLLRTSRFLRTTFDPARLVCHIYSGARRQVLQGRCGIRADCARSRRSPPEALRRVSLGVAGASQTDRGCTHNPNLHHGGESLVHIAFPSPDHPKAPWRRREAGGEGMLCEKGGDKGVSVTPCHLEIGAHRIQAGRSPEARQRRREAVRRKECGAR